MRFVVVGAGAIGGVVGGFLARSGADVAFVARGEHGRHIAAHGLEVRTPQGPFTVQAPCAVTPSALLMGDRDVVLLCVKGQDTQGAVDALVEAGAAPHTPVACLQNGVANEALVALRFDHVYGVPVMSPATHLEVGVVEAKAGPVPAILDIGCYPSGTDDTAAAISAAFDAAGMVSEVRPDIMRWKWSKLLMNLGNAIEVICGPAARISPLGKAVNQEGRAVVAAAGIDVASAEEDRERRGDILQWTPSADSGGSTWQSATRGTPLETDLLTGEIVRLARKVGIDTPVNDLVLRLAHEQAERGGVGGRDPDEVLADSRGTGR
jgi:2-dehydropantoate 2-reductase